MTIRCIARVCAAYGRDKRVRPVFRRHAAVPFQMNRNVGFKSDSRVSISTLNGRIIVPFAMGSHQSDRFSWPKGQSDLVLRGDGKWFLMVTVTTPIAAHVALESPSGFIGVDMGVNNLATTDDGENFSGGDIEKARLKYQRIRKTCQRSGTRSAKRKLKKVGNKESRFRRDTNHCIGKAIVAKAKGTASAIAIEDLDGIGGRTTVRRQQRSRMRGWAFRQLRIFITYKASLAGILVVPVDPRNTSRMCSECGHTERANRRSRDDFECRHCGFKLPADWNAARNIRDRAAAERPNVGADEAGTMPRLMPLTSPRP